MKRLLIALLCLTALSSVAYGSPFNRTTQEKPAPEQKDKKNYDPYVGQYEVAKDSVLTMANEGGKLTGQPTNDEKVEFKPEAAAETFFSRDVNARLKFVGNEKDEATGGIVTIGGKDFSSRKIK
jgi:hypothetical protein